MELERLVKLNLREAWNNEAIDFTPWLAQEKNIKLLSETIGIELEVQGQEENVGPFRADILCKDTINEHYVLIENQLEKTDHTHLGQIMTYAAGLDAVTIIWIAKQFTEEHRAALDWLNRITDDTFNFFGIEIELYKIGNSLPAPMFNIAAKPNDWSKQVKYGQQKTYTQLLQRDYWQALKNYMEENNSFIRMQNPYPQCFTNMSLGRSNFALGALVNSRDCSINIWMSINGDKANEYFDKLYNIAYKDSLNKISSELVWDKLEEQISSNVTLKTNGDFTNKSEWPAQFAWFKENLEKFDKFFRPKIKDI